MTYITRLGSALAQWLRDGDVLVNEAASVDLPDTAKDQTVSSHVALLDRDGNWFGCVFCKFLDIAVQPHHCELMATSTPSPWWVYPRAAFWFLTILVGLPWLAWRLL
jgi:hypothetical protein